jgi:hypothetical protein
MIVRPPATALNHIWFVLPLDVEKGILVGNYTDRGSNPPKQLGGVDRRMVEAELPLTKPDYGRLLSQQERSYFQSNPLQFLD